jgi:diacylglycerol kinase family enzyme
MNPRSGGGKGVRFGLKDKAEALGATVALLEGPGPVDVAALARQAVAEGADLLGVAGGDGTQALVAGTAAEHDVPLLVISAGTRNHFALDLGLDRDDPARCLDALVDGVELHVDLGFIGGRPFVTTPPSGPMRWWCRARPTATTRPGPPWTCCPSYSSATAGRGWWPGPGR